jgi:NTP pyrophosphatase (non-canonical NTP hydrolase)
MMVSARELPMNDESSTIRDLDRLAAKFAASKGWDPLHTPKDLAIGITTEAAELLQLFRFKTQEEISTLLTQKTFRDAAEDELGDIVFLLVRFAGMCGFDLSTALERKLKNYEGRLWEHAE